MRVSVGRERGMGVRYMSMRAEEQFAAPGQNFFTTMGVYDVVVFLEREPLPEVVSRLKVCYHGAR